MGREREEVSFPGRRLSMSTHTSFFLRGLFFFLPDPWAGGTVTG